MTVQATHIKSRLINCPVLLKITAAQDLTRYMKNLQITGGRGAPSVLYLLIVSTAGAAQEARPDELDDLKRMMQEVIAQNQRLAERVRELETEMSELKAERAKDITPPIGEVAEEDPGDRTVSFGGAVEVEADWREDFDNQSESDIRLETAEFDVEVQLTEWTAAALAIEWDRDEDKVTVDEAFITLGDTEQYPVFLTAGRVFVPFGLSTGDEVGDTLSITNPLTFDVFETREDVVLLGADLGGWVVGAYAFNGDSRQGGVDHIEHFGATVRYGMENDDMGFRAGVDLIGSAFDADGLTEAFPEALAANPEFGIAAHVKFRMNGFSLVTEYNRVLGEVDFTLDGEAVSISPAAWQVEGGYSTDLYGKATFIAINYSQTDELAGAFPESRISATVGRWLSGGLRLSFEYLHDDDYEESEGGTGNSADAVTGQLTYEW